MKAASKERVPGEFVRREKIAAAVSGFDAPIRSSCR